MQPLPAWLKQPDFVGKKPSVEVADPQSFVQSPYPPCVAESVAPVEAQAYAGKKDICWKFGM